MINDPNQPRRPRTGIIITIVVILLIILGVYLFHKKPVEVNNQSTDNTSQTQSASETSTPGQPNSTTDSNTDNSNNVNSTPGSNPDNSSNVNSTPGSNPDNSSNVNSTPGSNPDNASNVNSTPDSNPDNASNVNSTPGSNPDNSSNVNSTPGSNLNNSNPNSTSTSTSPMTSSQSNNGVLPSPKPLSPFKLTDDQGKTFSNDNLKGRWTLLFFGFSRCGDVCPTTLTQLNKMMGQLQQNLPKKSLPQVMMITVDPETDTTAVMHKYVKNFNPNFIGAVPDTQTLDTFSKDLGMHYEKVPQGSNGYVMNHSADLYLINPEGNVIASFAYPRDDANLVQSYENIVKSNNQST